MKSRTDRLTTPRARVLVLLAMLGTSQAQQTRLMTFFLPDSEPKSLEASVIAVNSHIVPPATYDYSPVTTLVIDCPKASSPDNDACRSAGIYPAQVYHTQGSVWGGATTFADDNSTTTWRCELGSPWATGGLTSTRSGDGGRCSKTIVADGATRTEATAFDPCYRAAHQLPVVVTAGGEKLSDYAFMTLDAAELDSIYSSEVLSMGCPSTTETLWVSAAVTTGGTSPSGSFTAPLRPTTTTPAPTGAPAGTTPAPTGAPTGTTAGSGEGSAGVTARPSGSAADSFLRLGGTLNSYCVVAAVVCLYANLVL